jgi:AraC family L-rhamnose operon regulatory protein RhaS
VPRNRPQYRESGKAFFADACAPLEQAAEAGKVRLRTLSRGQYPGLRLPRGVLPGLRTIGLWDAGHEQDWGLVLHRNEGIELTFAERGVSTFSVSGREYRLGPDHLTVTRPWQPHRIGNPNVGAGRILWLIVDVGVRRPHQAWMWPSWLVMTEADRKQLTRMLRENEQAVWHVSEDVRRCFQRVGEVLESDHAVDDLSLLTVYLNELFVLLLRMFREGRMALDQSLTSPQRTLELFWEELRGDRDALRHEWTLPMMARRCDLGVTRFVQYSKQLTNMSPMQYLSHCRIEAAGRLLREEPQRSITEIALDCGFSSSQYFAKVFRHRMGCMPRVYRLKADA